MGCKQLTCRADGGGAANASASASASANANSVGPAPDGSYALYGPEHIAFVVKRARAMVSDVLHAMGLGTVSKEALLTVASDLLKFLDEVMADSLPVLGEARFRKRFSPCACGRETVGRSDTDRLSNGKPKLELKPKARPRPAKAKGGRHA